MQLSIIIITLNEENYVWKLLDCLKNQTFKDFEVIVVDGNSQDKTLEVVEKYKESLGLRVIESKEKGASLQRNLGAKNAKYDHLVFFDADILISNDFLQEVVNYFSKNDVDYISSWYIPIEKSLLNKSFMFFYDIYISLLQNISGFSAGAFIFIKKDVFFDVGGFDEQIVYSEDRDFTKRAFKKGYKFAFLKNPKVECSSRRFEKEGRLKVAFSVLGNELKQVFGTKFNRPKMINYKFGHYDKD